MQPYLGYVQVINVECAGHSVELPAGRREERPQGGVRFKGPGQGGCETVLAPEVGAGCQQPAAVPPATPPRFYEQIRDRSDIWPKHLARILVWSQCRLISITRGHEPNQVRLLRLFHRDKNPVPWRRRGLNRGQPTMVHPGFVELFQCLARENAAVGIPPGRKLQACDLGGVVGTCRSDEGERHGR